jgi:KaiC/GvpD/RAD55 family RecA-like ATPase/predicted RNA-binding protein
MTNYWLLVVNQEEYNPGGEVIGLPERWKDTLQKVKQGDRVLTYVAKQSEFVDFSVVRKEYYYDEKRVGTDRAHPHRIKVGDTYIPETPLPVVDFIPKLKFVTNKERWYTHFNKAIQHIPKEDFQLIRSAIEKKRRTLFRSMKKTSEEIKKELEYRVPTGIPGLDEIIEGGFPHKSTILLTGGPGCGKTIFSMQYLLHGVTLGEPGIMVSMDERPEELRREMLKFGWDITKYEAEDLLAIVDVSYPRSGLPSKEKYKMGMPFSLDTVVTTIFDIIQDLDARRVVLDSLPAFGLHFDNETDVRMAIHRLNNLLLSSGCTSIITSEIIPGHWGISRYGVEEFISRGIIILETLKEGNEYSRRMTLMKMRETNFKMRMYKFNITEKGIVVLPTEVRI